MFKKILGVLLWPPSKKQLALNASLNSRHEKSRFIRKRNTKGVYQYNEYDQRNIVRRLGSVIRKFLYMHIVSVAKHIVLHRPCRKCLFFLC